MFISKRFEKVGDPLVLIKGSREERRMKLIEKYRQDIQKRKAAMDECMIIELEKQAAAKKCDILEISDEDLVYLAWDGKTGKNLIPSRNSPVQRVSDWSQNDNSSLFPRSQSSGTRVFMTDNENFAIYEQIVPQNSQNNDNIMQNRNFTNSQISKKVNSVVLKRKIENEPSIAAKKSRIFEEPTVEASECRIHNQLYIIT